MDTLYRILELIRKRGLTDSKFAELTGLNKAVLFDWRSGKTKSYNKHLPKIAEVLGVSVDYLLGETNMPTQEQKDEFSKLSALMSPEEQQKVKEYMEFLISQRDKKENTK